MVSWWPGDGNTLDLTGLNNGILWNITTFAPGKVGQAFSFDGADDYVIASGTNINDLQQLTIDAWVNHNSLPPGQVQRYVTLIGEKAVLRYDGNAGSRQLHFYMTIDGVVRHIRVDDVLQVGVFHHVAGTYDGSHMRLFLDGVEIDSLAVSGTVGAGTDVLLSSDWESLDGLLDEIEIYNRALSTSEIQAIFDAGDDGKCKPPLPPVTYNATGEWSYSVTNNWADPGTAGPACQPRDNVSGTAIITQTGNSVTMVDKDGYPWTGTVIDDDYTLWASFSESGGTAIAILNFTLSSRTVGSGTNGWWWTDGFFDCDGGADVSLTLISSPTLSVTIPSVTTEGDGILAGQGTVNISQALGADLVVSLVSSDITELMVPATVTIPQDSDTFTFDLTVVDDLEIDDTQTVTVTASATGFTPANATIDIQDNDDTDGDSLPDWWEIQYFGDLSQDGSGDYDGDELDNLAEYQNDTYPNDEDSDDDEMWDGWEVQYGLDPLDNSDANDDLDGDGLTNLEEFLAGRHPKNWEPEQPELYLPPEGEPDVSLMPELETADFSDNDGDDHALTQWQISSAPFPVDAEPEPKNLVIDLTSETYLTLFQVPPLILNANNTEYFWRARFTDSDYATSDWAVPFSFTTLDVSPEDNDPADGIPDGQEADCLAIFDPDAVPQDTACFNAVVGNVQIGMQGSNNVASIEACGSVDPVTIPENLQGVELAMGLISFKAICNQVGDIIEIIYYCSEPIPAGAKWYKYDPVNGWQDYSAHIVLISADRKSITVEYQDGGFGDLDGVANGVIIDPSGPGVAAAGSGGGGSGGGGGGGGCLISTVANGFRIPIEILAFMFLFGSLLISFSELRKKLKK
jgi:hypothetical protein